MGFVRCTIVIDRSTVNRKTIKLPDVCSKVVVYPFQLLVRYVFLCSFATTPLPVFADAVAEMQKKLQNPLANIKVLMTDNVIGFDSGSTDDTSFGFQILG